MSEELDPEPESRLVWEVDPEPEPARRPYMEAGE